jgi:hypothetical protein
MLRGMHLGMESLSNIDQVDSLCGRWDVRCNMWHTLLGMNVFVF